MNTTTTTNSTPANLYKPVEIERYTVGNQTLWRVANLQPIKAKRMNSLEASIRPEDYPQPEHDRPRLVVACGMGVDSVAMLVLMHQQGIRPDCIQWADTGSERQHTYRYINVLQAWLQSVGFPPVVIVRRRCPQAGHRSLYEQAWNTKQLPSAAFFKNHSCSIEWKLKPQRRYQALLPWLWDDCGFETAIGFDADELPNRKGAAKVTEAIGLDAAEVGDRRSVRYSVDNDQEFKQWYPLAEWGYTRAMLLDVIDAAGLPRPGKSACTICPVSKMCELREMEADELSAALQLEERFTAAQQERGGKYRGFRKMVTWAEWMHEHADKIVEPGLGLQPGATPAPLFASV